MIDVGVNLTNSRFDKDRSEVLARAKAAKISAMLITGTNLAESKQAILQCRQDPHYLYCTAGIHPHDADQADKNYLETLYQLAQHDCVRAIVIFQQQKIRLVFFKAKLS